MRWQSCNGTLVVSILVLLSPSRMNHTAGLELASRCVRESRDDFGDGCVLDFESLLANKLSRQTEGIPWATPHNNYQIFAPELLKTAAENSFFSIRKSPSSTSHVEQRVETTAAYFKVPA